jgi:serine phosphatase RsbU (regulator of sigma subunit)
MPRSEACLPLMSKEFRRELFAETRYQKARGDRLTFVSDGVVEASNPNGELHGLARTRPSAISPRSRLQRQPESSAEGRHHGPLRNP